MLTTPFVTPKPTEMKTTIGERNETHSTRSPVEVIGTGTREEGRTGFGETIGGRKYGHVPYRGRYRSICGQVFDHHRSGTAQQSTGEVADLTTTRAIVGRR